MKNRAPESKKDSSYNVKYDKKTSLTKMIREETIMVFKND